MVLGAPASLVVSGTPLGRVLGVEAQGLRHKGSGTRVEAQGLRHKG
jgi:hypothetical protein